MVSSSDCDVEGVSSDIETVDQLSLSLNCRVQTAQSSGVRRRNHHGCEIVTG